MNINTLFEEFSIAIPLAAHLQAEKFRRHQSQPQKAKQVYLNTLAVSVGQSYLNLLGWSTSFESSDCWNPILQTIMNVADLHIPSYGKLECRTVFSEETRVKIPPEVWSGRIGYLIVMLDGSLKQGCPIGFARQVNKSELDLTELEPLGNFPAYLSQKKRIQPSETLGLSNWTKGGVASHGWQRLDRLFSPSMGLEFRSKSELAQAPGVNLAQSGVKLISLGANQEQSINLVLNIQSLNQSEFNVSIKVSNHQYGKYLPEGLELVIVDRLNIPVMIAQANQTEIIEFCFSGELNEKFSVEISLEDDVVIENFVI
ncbi:MAG: DUF1822 family protein [Cyanobacteria bacterium J06623_7]